MNPLARPHSEAAMWFYASQNLLMGVDCCFSVIDIFNSFFHIPLLVPEQSPWSGRRGRAASTISLVAFVNPSNKDTLCARGSLSLSSRVSQAQKHLIIVRGSSLPSGSISLPFPVSGWENEEGEEGSEVRLHNWEKTCQKRPNSRALSITGSANSDPSWWPKRVTAYSLLSTGKIFMSVFHSFIPQAFIHKGMRNNLCSLATWNTVRVIHLRGCNWDMRRGWWSPPKRDPCCPTNRGDCLQK